MAHPPVGHPLRYMYVGHKACWVHVHRVCFSPLYHLAYSLITLSLSPPVSTSVACRASFPATTRLDDMLANSPKSRLTKTQLLLAKITWWGKPRSCHATQAGGDLLWPCLVSCWRESVHSIHFHRWSLLDSHARCAGLLTCQELDCADPATC